MTEAPGLCPRCQKSSHWANQCKSKFHKNGFPLKLGNSQGASLRPHKQWGHALWGPPPFSVLPTSAAVSGNAVWDLPSRLTVQISESDPCLAILTGIRGPILQGTIGLILGRSGFTLKGFQILPGLVDPDYSGEIKVMALSHSFQVIPQGQQMLSSFSCLTVPLTILILSSEGTRMWEHRWSSSVLYSTNTLSSAYL